MKISQEVFDAIRHVCIEYQQDEELVKMIRKAIENKLDNSYANDDLRDMIKKVILSE